MSTPSQTPPTGPERRVGFVPGVTLTKWRRVWAERFPEVALTAVEVPEADARAGLDDGLLDACFARLPLETHGLHVVRLYEEVPVAWVAKDHPIALFDEVTLADLAAETVLTTVDPAALSRVLHEDAVLAVPLSVARSGGRKDLTHRPVTDGVPTTIALVWAAADEHPLVQEFVGIVRGRTARSSRGDAAAAATKAGTPASGKPTRSASARGRSGAPKPPASGRGRGKQPRGRR